jgi:tetratricopeptide (TPR) repeat protein
MKEFHILLHDHRNPIFQSDGDYIKLPDASFVSQEQSEPVWETQFQQRSTEWDRKVRSNPSNAKYWIQFAKFQDEMLLSAPEEVRRSLPPRIITKKLAILEKALEELPNSEEIVELYMDILQEVKDSREMLSKWDEVLRYQPYSFLLWKKYLDYRCSNAASFALEDILRLYSDCLHVLSKLDTQRDECLMHIFARVCVFLKQSGYTERAVGCFQALIEFNCFCPTKANSSNLFQKLEEFREFWDLECPRFGDEGAIGWERSISSELHQEGVVPDIDGEVEQFDMIENDFERWVKKESRIMQTHWIPLRNSVQEYFDDPYQTVLFEDIKPFLFEIKSHSKKAHLIDLFLEFLGVPLGLGRASTHMMYQDVFLCDDFSYDTYRNWVLGHETNCSMKCPFVFYPHGIDSFYDISSTWPSSLCKEHLQSIQIGKADGLEFVLRVLGQAKRLFPNTRHYSGSILWIEFLLDPKRYYSLMQI